MIIRIGDETARTLMKDLVDKLSIALLSDSESEKVLHYALALRAVYETTKMK